MKTRSFFIALSVLIALSLCISTEALGQRHGPPEWAPAHGYRAHTRHIYFPDYNMYYDLQRRSYIYMDNGNWRVSVELPVRYRAARLSTSPFIELEINSNTPQRYYMEPRAKYKTYKHSGYYYENRRRDRDDNWNRGRDDDRRGNNGNDRWNNRERGHKGHGNHDD